MVYVYEYPKLLHVYHFFLLGIHSSVFFFARAHNANLIYDNVLRHVRYIIRVCISRRTLFLFFVICVLLSFGAICVLRQHKRFYKLCRCRGKWRRESIVKVISTSTNLNVSIYPYVYVYVMLCEYVCVFECII